jgi:hypothetical protein
MQNNINFTEEIIVSIHEKQRNKKLKIFSLVFLTSGLVLALLVFLINVIIVKNFEDAKAVEVNLVQQVQKPENVKKETLYFLIKDRLRKIGLIDSGRIKLSQFLSTFSEIDKLIKIDSLTLVGNTCELTLETDKYLNFEDFIQKFEQFGIIKDSIKVQNTLFQNGKYKITVKFVLKTKK